MIDQSKIRNFCIIAQIDHGKSTLADRIIEKTGLLTSREMQEQVLDNMDLERERGITIKSQAVRTVYRAEDGEEYIFNLIDTPGHADFGGEVERVLKMVNGVVLVVDAYEGAMPQTKFVLRKALELDLDVVCCINKCDRPEARPDEVVDEHDRRGEDLPQEGAHAGEVGADVEDECVQAQCDDVEQNIQRELLEDTDILLRLEDVAPGEDVVEDH